jgi:ankyrin repeat protein
MATLFDHIEIVKMLIKAKSDINLQDEEGDTPLHLAYKKNNPEIIKLLLESGANPELQNKNNLTPIENIII